jgi:hypothetical protein
MLGAFIDNNGKTEILKQGNYIIESALLFLTLILLPYPELICEEKQS